ncbi:hypothetical protein [Lentzea sp. NPDC059081]|uniref:hypothetical protein n=1 Tax=Lentzea sp. NPDC059081 TaxID=3346719 RepID=UPI0036AE30F8
MDTVDADAEAEEFENDGDERVGGIGWKALALFIGGGLLVTALAVAFTVWVINALVL